MDIELVPSSTRYDADNDGWRRHVSALLQELSSTAPTRLHDEPAKGEKGAASTIILSLGSSGALLAVVEIVRLWIQRDPTRQVELSRGPDGSRKMVITEKNTKTETDLVALAREFYEQG